MGTVAAAAAAAAAMRGEEGGEEEGGTNFPPKPPNRVWGPGWRAAERATRPAGERGEAATEENGPNNWKRERDLCQATLWEAELLTRWPPDPPCKAD